MIAEKLHEVGQAIIKVYPEQIDLDIEVMEERITFLGTVRSVEGKYSISGFVTMDELIRLGTTQVAALVLMRSLIEG